jgi:hypothetical protein
MSTLLTVAQVAPQLGHCEKWVYEHKYQLGFVLIGRKIFFRQSVIDEYLQRSEVAAK